MLTLPMMIGGGGTLYSVNPDPEPLYYNITYETESSVSGYSLLVTPDSPATVEEHTDLTFYISIIKNNEIIIPQIPVPELEVYDMTNEEKILDVLFEDDSDYEQEYSFTLLNVTCDIHLAITFYMG